MLKRRYGNRQGWKRVVEREYAQDYFETDTFAGYVSLLKINKVTEPLVVQYEDEKVCIVDHGYAWLFHFPQNKNYTVTTMFNAEGEVVQWYIDICKETGVDSRGVPWMDDLFLDIVILPSGQLFVLDEDELDAALESGVISQEEFQIARSEAERISKLIKSDSFELLSLAKEHKEILNAQLPE